MGNEGRMRVWEVKEGCECERWEGGECERNSDIFVRWLREMSGVDVCHS